MLKWTGALAAVGVVGVGLGLGGDLLLRPNTTSGTTQTTTLTQPGSTQTVSTTATATQTATQTVTAPPTTLSYVPPLSPSVQTRVNQIIQNMVSSHAGETRVYQPRPLQAIVKNGAVIGTVPEDIVNPTIGREDSYLSQDDFQKGRLRGMPWENPWILPWQIQDPTRVLYPMQRTGPRGDPNNAKFVRITWDNGVSPTLNQIKACKTKYGAYSVETGGVCADHVEPWLQMYGVACNGGWGCASSANTMLAHSEVLGNPYSSGGNMTDVVNSEADCFLVLRSNYRKYARC